MAELDEGAERPKFLGREISVNMQYAETGRVGRMVTLCARMAVMGAEGKTDFVHGPAEIMTSVAGIVWVSFVDLSV